MNRGLLFPSFSLGQTTQQAGAAFLYIPPGALEITGVPGVGHLAGAGGVVQQGMDLVGRVAAEYALHIAQVSGIHADEQVPIGLFVPPQLPGGLAPAGNPMFSQLPACRGIDWVPDLLRAGGGGGDLKSGLQPHLFHQVLHHELRHRAPANIAVADK